VDDSDGRAKRAGAENDGAAFDSWVYDSYWSKGGADDDDGDGGNEADSGPCRFNECYPFICIFIFYFLDPHMPCHPYMTHHQYIYRIVMTWPGWVWIWASGGGASEGGPYPHANLLGPVKVLQCLSKEGLLKWRARFNTKFMFYTAEVFQNMAAAESSARYICDNAASQPTCCRKSLF
jgi:hypothetical protein